MSNLIFALYFICANLGLKLATLHETVSPVWPATGIAIGAITFFGFRYLPSIFIGAFLTNYLVNVPQQCAFTMAVGNTMEAFIGATIILALRERKYRFGYYCKTVSIMSASMIASAVSATIGISSLIFFKATTFNDIGHLWLTWWTGDTLGGIIILPLFFMLMAPEEREEKIDISLFQIITLIASGALLSWTLFFTNIGAPFLFLVFPYLLYCVVRAGIKGVTIATLAICFLGIIAVKEGHGVFLNGTVNTNYINVQFFLASMGLCSLVLTDLKKESLLKKPSLILILTWLSAGLIFTVYHTHAKKMLEDNYQKAVQEMPQIIQEKMTFYFAALQNGASLFAASTEVTRNEWRSFINQGDYFSSHPGLKYIGVIFPVESKRVDQFVKKQQKDFPPFNYSRFNGLRVEDDAYIITFIEPMAIGQDKVGFDINSEEKRARAAELARDTGKPQISNQVMLDTGSGPRPSIIAFFPFYKDGGKFLKPTERRQMHKGWIYAHIDVQEFFSAIFPSGTHEELSFGIYENSNNSPLYISKDFQSTPGEETIVSILVGERRLLLHAKRSLNYMNSQDDFSSWTGALTAILSILLGTFIVTLQAARSKAQAEAARYNEELKSSEELLKFALEGSGDSVWEVDYQNKIVTFNYLFGKMMGYLHSQPMCFTFENFSKNVHPEDLEKACKELHGSVKQGVNYQSEYRLRHHNGNYKWFLSRGRVVKRDANGDALRIVGTISDVTSRKYAQEKIASERTKFESIFEHSHDAIILISENYRPLECNTAAVKMFGFNTKPEFMDQNHRFLSVLPYSHQPNGVEWDFTRKNGELFPAEVTFSSFIYDNQKVIQISIKDLSERKIYEASLRKQQELLMASAKMSSLGEMAGGIAHEINNPLSIVVGKVAQLKRNFKTLNPEKVEDDLVTIESTAKRIAAIVKGLKAFSRNAEQDSKQKVVIPGLIKDLFELSKERFKFHHIDLIFEQHCKDPVIVKARAAQILQVLVNLLNNAFDAVENLDEKWVKLELENRNGKCVIMITDSGHGIEKRILDKIMSPFFTTKPVDKGTGLGLSISKTIIEEHGGHLYYDGSSGHTRFIIELPLISDWDYQAEYN